MKKVIKVIYTASILLVMILGIIIAITAFEINLPIKIYAVQTGSMEPAIITGDLILVRGEDNYEVDDIVTFYSGSGEGSRVITHRIESINDDGLYVTKGDANSVSDVDLVQKDNVIGKYFFRIPYLGYVVNFSKTPMGFFLLIIVPAMIFAYGEIDKIRNEIKNIKSKKGNIQI